MSSAETMYLAGAIVAFVLFAAVVAWVDQSTRDVRERKK